MDHPPFIHRCLELAQQGRGKVGINPMVGAVLVRDSKIIAEAFHEGFGLPHAERTLLENFKDSVESDDVLYVNLEPCCHKGKTPPCTDIILEKGVKHVVYGMKDPNPKVAGRGIEALRKAGVEVFGPVEPELCKRLNRGFMSLQTNGRPYITLKRAQTCSGKISKPDGSPLKITSQDQDEWAHTNLRAKHDAILVGIGTILKDDPQLTVRFGSTDFQSLRIVLDPNLEVPLDAKIISEGTIVIVKDTSEKRITTKAEQAFPPAWAEELRKRGVKIIEIPMKNSIFDFDFLFKILTTTKDDFNGVTSILVEGGAKTWENFKESGMVDEEIILVGD
ncbi:MAG: bifunctional diaminohydroxyphosphoribosylaminopyrimidine deaminase/5-amino-6-(5-phosphoribosylamino)uracil reductase RibD [Patescibacteria group bacterium]